MSLLLAQGHADANAYPLSRVFYEAQIVRERLNAEAVTQAVLIQAATATTGMTAGPKAQKGFKDLMDSLKGD